MNSIEKIEIEQDVKPCDIAIIGMASHFPDAADLYDFWSNIVNKHDAIRDIDDMDSVEYWDSKDYFDPDPKAVDKVYGRKAGFVPPIDLNCIEFKLPPSTLQSISTAQLFALHVAKQAMADAGLLGEAGIRADPDRIGVILGGSGNGNTAFSLAMRQQSPYLRRIMVNSGLSEPVADEIIGRLKEMLLEWDEDSFPGFLGNVACGRIASYFNLGGTSYMIDAACASSLAAVKAAIGELAGHSCDVVLTGGVNLENSIFSFLCFSKTPALSKSNLSRPFDQDSDGMMLGDGVGFLVLKRLADAKRDGDRVYAVIKGVGASSDGRAKSIFAPRSEGQVKAIERAHRQAGVSFNDIQLVEAHGTGTQSGDDTEIKSLIRVCESQGVPASNSIAIGSIKSQIGHTRCAAGAVSMMKMAMALHHKVLPPTINVKQPTKVLGGNFYVNTSAKPWLAPSDGRPRRAALSAFGFGGTNYHAVLEEYAPEPPQTRYRMHRSPEVIALHAPTPGALATLCQSVITQLQSDDAAQWFARHVADPERLSIPAEAARIGFASASPEEVLQALRLAVPLLQSRPNDDWDHPSGIYYKRNAAPTAGHVVALFPGQGAQYVNMGCEVATDFPEFRQAIEKADAAAAEAGLAPLSEVMFPPPSFTAADATAQLETLTRTSNAQPAIGAISAGYLTLLRNLGFSPDFVAGHSYGELTALWAAGVLNDADFHRASLARGLCMQSVGEKGGAGSMLAAQISEQEANQLLAQFSGVEIANYNSPVQTVFGGPREMIGRLQDHLTQQRHRAQILTVSTAFHTAFVTAAAEPFREALKNIEFGKPQHCALYSCATAQPVTDDGELARTALVDQMLQPVRFAQMVSQIHADGGRIFVEIGPRGVLGKLVEEILRDKPHTMVSLDRGSNGADGLQFRQGLAKLVVEGVPLSNADPYAIPKMPTSNLSKNDQTITLNGGFYLSEKNINRRENALRKDNRVVEQFIREHGRGQSQPENSAEPPTSAPLAFDLQKLKPIASPRQAQVSDTGKEEIMKDVSLNESADELSDRIRAQNIISDTHRQFQDNQKEYIHLLGDLINKQHSLLEKYHGHTQMESMTASMERTLNLLERNQELYHQNHEHYFHNQQALLGDDMDRRPGNGGRAVMSQPLLQKPAPATESLAVPAHAPRPRQPDAGLKVEIAKAPMKAATEPAKVTIEATPVPQSKPGSAPAPAANASAGASVGDAGPMAADREKLQLLMQLSSADLIADLIGIVSDRTGYPVDMIGAEMDLEADLGIDSIKRLEIFGAMFDKLAAGKTLVEDLDKLGEDDNFDIESLGNIRKMADFFVEVIANLAQSLQDGSAVTRKSDLIADSLAASPVDAPALDASASNSDAPIEPEVKRLLEQLAALTEDDLIAELTTVVSDRTGYPVDMIAAEMDLEADLGIDSIKRLEIFGAMFDKLAAGKTLVEDLDKLGEDDNFDIESLGNIRKMAQFFIGVIDELVAQNGGSAPKADGAAPFLNDATPVTEESSVPTAPLRNLGVVTSTKRVPGNLAPADHGDTARQEESSVTGPFRQQVVLRRLGRPDRAPLTLSKDRIWLLVDDDAPLGDEVARRLIDEGQAVTRLNISGSVRKPKRRKSTPKALNTYPVDSTEPKAIADLLAEVERIEGTVGGLIYLQGALSPASIDDAFIASDYDAMQKLVAIAGALQPGLHGEGVQGHVMTVTRHDGRLSTSGKLFPIVGSGVGGLAKSLAVEWSGVSSRSVDLDPAIPKEKAAELLMQELQDPATDLAEVGISADGTRVTLDSAAVPANETSISFDPDAVMLFTGGARGITAASALALAGKHRVNLALLGRTPIDQPLPEWAGADLDSDQLKAAAIGALQAKGEQPTPVQVEQMISGILHAREVRQVLQQVQDAGSKAAYFCCDITDPAQVAATLDVIREMLGPVQALVHGAGQLADKRIEKKTAADFTKVFHTKVKGLENLMAALDPSSLRQVVLFSSVSGFYGNAGQTDYAMANEVLNKFAHAFQAAYPQAFVRSIGWGPWDHGMVHDALKKAYDSRGLVIIPGDVGTAFFTSEFGAEGGPQILVGGESYRVMQSPKAATITRIVEREVSTETCPFLVDHELEGYLVLPATMAASWIVELAKQALPGHHFEALQSFRVLKGVTLTPGESCVLTARVNARLADETDASRYVVEIMISTPNGERPLQRYNGTVVMGCEKVAPPPRLTHFDITPTGEALGYPLYGVPEEIPLLFHGPSFRGVQQVLNRDGQRLSLACQLKPVALTAQGAFGTTAINPYIYDVYLQGIWLWLMISTDYAGLPSAIGRAEHFAPLVFDQPFYLSVDIKTTGHSSLIADVIAHDENGLIYDRLTDVEFTLSREIFKRMLEEEEEFTRGAREKAARLNAEAVQ